jgi:GntR family transcriptional regulator
MQFRLDSKSGVPIYRQIQDQIRYGISSGRLTPSQQLPTVRAMAVELSVNPNTVIKAYSELEREGLLTTEQGTGTFVSSQAPRPVPKSQREAKLRSLCSEFLAQLARYGFTAAEAIVAIDSIIDRRSSDEQE